jgi:hypothetical protein
LKNITTFGRVAAKFVLYLYSINAMLLVKLRMLFKMVIILSDIGKNEKLYLWLIKQRSRKTYKRAEV